MRRLTVLAIALTTLLAAPAAHAARRDLAAPAARAAHPDLGTFAGYLVPQTGLRSVRGSWRAPRAPRVAPGELSSVWIGASAPGAPLTAPFIQVGIVITGGVLGGETIQPFWSDTADGFLVQPLRLAVRSGDRLRASLVLTGGRWHVALRDLTTHRSAQITTAQDARARFDEAQWLQEDPLLAAGIVHVRPEPYALTSPVRFTALAMNGRDPSAGSADSRWMSLPHRDLGPTAITGDSFSVVTRRLSPAALRYLRLVAPEDRAAAAVDATLTPWRRGAATVTAPARRLISALRAVRRGLLAPGWPPSAAAALTALARANVGLIALVARAPALAPAARGAWIHAWTQDAARLSHTVRTVRRLLGIPDIISSDALRRAL